MNCKSAARVIKCPQSGGAAYFCTPRGASIIGSEGVDGVHYCFVRGYGGAVFAVSPLKPEPERVQPVAPDFFSFLRLLAACGHSAAVEQCSGMTREGFAAYLRANPPSAAARDAIAQLNDRLGVTPMPDPYGFIISLQAGFDLSRLKYAAPERRAAPAHREAPATPVCEPESASG